MNSSINDLDEYSLESIFRLLNVFDLRACSCVCLRWHQITKRFAKDQLVLNYAIPSFRVTSSSKISQIINQGRRSNGQMSKNTTQMSDDGEWTSSVYRVSSNAIRISDSRILSSSNRNFLRTIRTLIFCGNGHFQPDSSFSLRLLPDLLHLEIRDRQFCRFLTRSRLMERFVCRSVRYLVLENSAADLLAAFPNLVYLETDYLGGFRLPSDSAPSKQLKHFCLNGQELTRPAVDFLTAHCGQIEFLDVKLDAKRSEVSLGRLLKDFHALKELNVHFEPCPVHSGHLVKLLVADFLGARNVQLVVHGIRLPKFDSHEQQLNYLNSLDAFFVRPHRLAYIDSGFLNDLLRQKKSRSGERIALESADVLDMRGFSNDLLERFSVRPFKKLNHLLIHSFTNQPSDPTCRLDTIRLMRSLPSTVKFVRLQFNHPIGQTVLDLLPVCFSFLEALDLIELGHVAYELSFLSALPYLASLRLHFILIEDVRHLLAAIANCRFLTQLFFVTSPRARCSFRRQLRQQFERKMKSSQMKISFTLNGVDGLQEPGSERLI